MGRGGPRSRHAIAGWRRSGRWAEWGEGRLRGLRDEHVPGQRGPADVPNLGAVEPASPVHRLPVVPHRQGRRGSRRGVHELAAASRARSGHAGTCGPRAPVQPTIVPACDEQEQGLRPVTACGAPGVAAPAHRRLALLGVRSREADRLARIDERVLADQILDLGPGALVERRRRRRACRRIRCFRPTTGWPARRAASTSVGPAGRSCPRCQSRSPQLEEPRAVVGGEDRAVPC